MSDIVWGEPIKVDGKRPEWLEDDEEIFGQDRGGGYSNHFPGWVLTVPRVDWEYVESIRLRRDHTYYTQRLDTESVASDPEIQKMMADAAKGFAVPVADDWKPDPRTVRACIEALPSGKRSENENQPREVVFRPSGIVYRECRAALEALLPKPDPAKALVEEWERGDEFELPDEHARKWCTMLAEHLLATGRLK